MSGNTVLCTGNPSCRNPVKLPETRCHVHRAAKASRVAVNRVAQAAQPTLFDFGSDETDQITSGFMAEPPQLPKTVGALPDSIPRYALFRGKRVRIVSYEGDNKFTVLDTNDSYRSLYRSQLTFLPETRRAR